VTLNEVALSVLYRRLGLHTKGPYDPYGINDDDRVLGEDGDGYVFIPDRHRPGRWGVRFDIRRPTHWKPWEQGR